MSQPHQFVKEVLAQIAAEHNVDPYSREFIFSGKDSYARLRNQLIALRPEGRMTLLSALLRYGLDENRRANTFSSPYHLGSTKNIPQSQLSVVDLARKVRKDKHATRTDEVGIWSDPKTLKKEFESITSALKGITGTTLGKYEDKQNALRLIYLLDRMMPGSGFAEERSKRLLTFIQTSTSRFSFEARDAYPIAESEGNTWLLNDLKSYIAIEIDNETLDRVDSTFNPLINRADEIRSHLDRVAYSSGLKSQIVLDYRSIVATVEAVDVSRPDARTRPPRLDLDLYLHLNRFEFLHFAGAYAEILDVARPPSPIASVQSEVVEALSALTEGPRNQYHTTVDNFWLDAFPGLANKHADLFLDLIGKALGNRPSLSVYEQSTSLAHELLYRTRIFGSGVSPGESPKVSFRNIVSALCAAVQAIECPVQYRPRVFGDDSQPRSIVTPLQLAMEVQSNRRPKEIPEGYLQIWHNRREWVQDALEGAYEMAELKFSLRRLLFAKLVECVRPNDIELIEENLCELEARLVSITPRT